MIKDHFFYLKEPKISFEDLVLPEWIRREIFSIFEEHKIAEKLESIGIPIRHRILFWGEPGTGKTACAEAIAQKYKKKLWYLKLEEVALSQNPSQTWKTIQDVMAKSKEEEIFFFDEFDAVAGDRRQTEPGSHARIHANSLLLLLDQISSRTIFIAATNYTEGMDGAFRRRFDAIFHFPMPTPEQRKKFILSLIDPLGLQYDEEEVQEAIRISEFLSFHELKNWILSSAKKSIIQEKNLISLMESAEEILSRCHRFRKNNFT